MKMDYLKLWGFASAGVITLDILVQVITIDGPPPEGAGEVRMFIGFVGLLTSFLMTIPITIPRNYLLYCIHLLPTGTYSVSRFYVTLIIGDFLLCLFYGCAVLSITKLIYRFSKKGLAE